MPPAQHRAKDRSWRRQGARLHGTLWSGSSLGGRRGWGALGGKRQQFLLDLHSTVDMPSPGSLSVNGPELGGGRALEAGGPCPPTLVTASSPTSSASSVCLEGNLPGVQAGALTRGKTHLCFFLQMGSRQYSVSPPGEYDWVLETWSKAKMFLGDDRAGAASNRPLRLPSLSISLSVSVSPSFPVSLLLYSPHR